jgi:antitoxin (DNA-binding transcriptional repressor) of toxin-antitoxin stability system
MTQYISLRDLQINISTVVKENFGTTIEFIITKHKMPVARLSFLNESEIKKEHDKCINNFNKKRKKY